MADAPPVIAVEDIVTRFGAQTVHDGITFSVAPGALVALIGGSGSGKSVLLREILGLQRPDAGSVRLLGTDMWNASDEALAATRKRFGMMFQEGALFSSLDVAGNVATPLLEHTDTPPHLLAAGLRRAFSGIVAGNVKESGIRLIEERGPFEIHGDPDVLKPLDALLSSFVAQRRMKLSGDYQPCYRVVA